MFAVQGEMAEVACGGRGVGAERAGEGRREARGSCSTSELGRKRASAAGLRSSPPTRLLWGSLPRLRLHALGRGETRWHCRIVVRARRRSPRRVEGYHLRARIGGLSSSVH